MTAVYIVYDASKSDLYKKKHYDSYMNEIYANYDSSKALSRDNDYVDKLEYYIDGNLFGYTYVGHYDFENNGRNYWDSTDVVEGSPFFLGLCPWSKYVFYLKGKVYATRLYSYPLTSQEVVDNMKATTTYHSLLFENEN